MTITIQVLDTLAPRSQIASEWDDLVASTDPSCFMQSIPWAKFKQKMGLEVLHLGLFEAGKLLGGSVFYTAPDNRGAAVMVAPDGPLLPWHEPAVVNHCMQLLLEEAKKHARRFNATTIRIAPRLRTPVPDSLADFSEAPLHLTESKTLCLKLDATPEDLLSAMRPKGRYNIRLAERKGVNVYEESSASAVYKFYSIMQQVSIRDGFAIEPFSFFINLLESLCSSNMMRIFFAEHEGDLLGTLLMVTFGSYTAYLYGGTSNSKRNLMGGYALQWTAINKARAAGAKVYDFWGFDPSCDPESNYAGFSRFKSQFGGEAIQYIGAQDYHYVDYLADLMIKALNEIPFIQTSPPQRTLAATREQE